MGAKKKIKFVVGNSAKWCSKVWTVRILHNDVYIMCGSGKYHKVSLHGSGVCHSAVTKEQAERFNISPMQRTNVRWKVNPQTDESVIAFTALISFEQMADRSASFAFSDNILSIPTPPVSTAAVIYFVKTRSNGKIVNWQFDSSAQLLTSIQLQSGDTLSIIYRYTAEFNHLIAECKSQATKFAQLAQKIALRKATSGFYVVSDSQDRMYYIELNL